MDVLHNGKIILAVLLTYIVSLLTCVCVCVFGPTPSEEWESFTT